MRSSYGGLGTRKSADRWSREPRVCVCVREGGRQRGNDREREREREREGCSGLRHITWGVARSERTRAGTGIL